MPAGVIELSEEDELSYFEKINVTCKEKVILNTFAKWVLDPPIEDLNFQCLPSSFCMNERKTSPIPVEGGDRKVLFAPFKNYLDETLLKFGPVEVDGQIFAYCGATGVID